MHERAHLSRLFVLSNKGHVPLGCIYGIVGIDSSSFAASEVLGVPRTPQHAHPRPLQ